MREQIAKIAANRLKSTIKQLLLCVRVASTVCVSIESFSYPTTSPIRFLFSYALSKHEKFYFKLCGKLFLCLTAHKVTTLSVMSTKLLLSTLGIFEFLFRFLN